jgi:hypothetical protein
MTVRICHSCGATDIEAEFALKVRGQPAPRLCLDCTRIAREGGDPSQRPDPPSQRLPQTRASYRAAYRHRLRQDQMDMVDLLRPPP